MSVVQSGQEILQMRNGKEVINLNEETLTGVDPESNLPSLEKPIVYTERWLMLFIFCLLQLTNAILWITFAPISNLVQHYFGGAGHAYGTKTAVNMFANIFLIIYPFSSIVGLISMKYFGPRMLMIFASVGMSFGAVIRYIGAMNIHRIGASSAYGLMLFGQAIIAITFPFIFNAVSRISSTWFPAHERDIATTLGSLTNPMGVAIGQIIPVLFVIKAGGKANDDNDDNYSVLGMNDLLFAEFIISLVPLIGVLLFFKDAPLTAPSLSSRIKTDNMTSSRSSSLENDQDVKENWQRVKKEIIDLFQDPNYLLLFFGFSIGVGSINAVITLLNQLIQPFGYSNGQAGTFGAVLIVVGLITAGIMSKVMARTKAYLTMLRIGVLLCCLSIFFLIAMLYHNNFWGLLIGFALLGGFSLPLLPILIENSAECTYPIAEEVSFGVMNIGNRSISSLYLSPVSNYRGMVGCNVIGIGIVFALQFLIDAPTFGPPPLTPSNLFLVCLTLIIAMLLLSYNGELKRLHYDQQP